MPEDDPGAVNAKLEFDAIDRFLWARLTFSNCFNNRGVDPRPWTDVSGAFLRRWSNKAWL